MKLDDLKQRILKVKNGYCQYRIDFIGPFFAGHSKTNDRLFFKRAVFANYICMIWEYILLFSTISVYNSPTVDNTFVSNLDITSA
jgi:hypothetical protein